MTKHETFLQRNMIWALIILSLIFLLLNESKKSCIVVIYLFFISLTVDAMWPAPPSFKSENN